MWKLIFVVTILILSWIAGAKLLNRWLDIPSADFNRQYDKTIL